MVQCAACRTEIKASQIKCHVCGAPNVARRGAPLPKLTPLDELEPEDEFKTLITQKEPVDLQPKTLPMVPPPFTPPPRLVTQPILSPSASDEAEDSFESGLGDFTEIAEHIPAEEDQEQLSDDEFDHTVDLEPEEFYSLDGEADFTPFPTAQLISPPPRPVAPPPVSSRVPPAPKLPSAPEVPAVPQNLQGETSAKRPQGPAQPTAVSALIVLAHQSSRARLERGAQRFGAQHDPTGGLLEELYPHHFTVRCDQSEVLLCPVSDEAELWMRGARRATIAMGDVVRIGNTRLSLARSKDVIRPIKSLNKRLPQAQVSQLSLLAFNSAGLLEGVFPLQEGVTRVGRACADITLTDPSLSLSHVALVVEEGEVTIVDLGSESGLWRQVHEPTPLVRGAVFNAGHTLFVAR